jgi:hypothetical protein
MQRRLLAALAAYAVISILAWVTLDGKMRLAVWILMAGFAIKTYIAYRAHWPE